MLTLLKYDQSFVTPPTQAHCNLACMSCPTLVTNIRKKNIGGRWSKLKSFQANLVAST